MLAHLLGEVLAEVRVYVTGSAERLADFKLALAVALRDLKDCREAIDVVMRVSRVGPV
jgi:hypothetical protein